MTDDNKDVQIKWLADRLALAVSFLSELEFDDSRFSEGKHMVLSELMSFEKQREKRRTTGFYERAMNDIRARLSSALKAMAA